MAHVTETMLRGMDTELLVTICSLIVIIMRERGEEPVFIKE